MICELRIPLLFFIPCTRFNRKSHITRDGTPMWFIWSALILLSLLLMYIWYRLAQRHHRYPSIINAIDDIKQRTVGYYNTTLPKPCSLWYQNLPTFVLPEVSWLSGWWGFVGLNLVCEALELSNIVRLWKPSRDARLYSTQQEKSKDFFLSGLVDGDVHSHVFRKWYLSVLHQEIWRVN